MDQGWGSVAFIVIMVAVFYFMLILPQKNQQKRRAAMLKAIKAGDKIETVARQMGVVCEIDGEYAVVDLGANGDRNRVRMHLEGIARTANDAEKPAEKQENAAKSA